MVALHLRRKKATFERARLAMRAASRDVQWNTPGCGTLVEEHRAAWARAGLQWGVHACYRCHSYGVREVRRTCVNKMCAVFVHRRCGTVGTSWGPVFCGCHEKIKLLPKLNRRSARRWRHV